MATILIVKDDIGTNATVCEYLQETSHTTIPAFDGNETITLFVAQKIDLIILDIMFPISFSRQYIEDAVGAVLMILPLSFALRFPFYLFFTFVNGVDML